MIRNRISNHRHLARFSADENTQKSYFTEAPEAKLLEDDDPEKRSSTSESSKSKKKGKGKKQQGSKGDQKTTGSKSSRSSESSEDSEDDASEEQAAFSPPFVLRSFTAPKSRKVRAPRFECFI